MENAVKKVLTERLIAKKEAGELTSVEQKKLDIFLDDMLGNTMTSEQENFIISKEETLEETKVTPEDEADDVLRIEDVFNIVVVRDDEDEDEDEDEENDLSREETGSERIDEILSSLDDDDDDFNAEDAFDEEDDEDDYEECPICGTINDEEYRYCEECDYDFEASTFNNSTPRSYNTSVTPSLTHIQMEELADTCPLVILTPEETSSRNYRLVPPTRQQGMMCAVEFEHEHGKNAPVVFIEVYTDANGNPQTAVAMLVKDVSEKVMARLEISEELAKMKERVNVQLTSSPEEFALWLEEQGPNAVLEDIQRKREKINEIKEMEARINALKSEL